MLDAVNGHLRAFPFPDATITTQQTMPLVGGHFCWQFRVKLSTKSPLGCNHRF